MTTLYRGVLDNQILYADSILIVPENINQIDFNKIVYCEISAGGAMGNAGGILIYILKDQDTLITYETNVFVNKEMYEAISKKIIQKTSLLDPYHGGFGNYVYVKKGINLEIDEKYQCFWYHSETTKLRIDSSVDGVFLRVAIELVNS